MSKLYNFILLLLMSSLMCAGDAEPVNLMERLQATEEDIVQKINHIAMTRQALRGVTYVLGQGVVETAIPYTDFKRHEEFLKIDLAVLKGLEEERSGLIRALEKERELGAADFMKDVETFVVSQSSTYDAAATGVQKMFRGRRGRQEADRLQELRDNEADRNRQAAIAIQSFVRGRTDRNRVAAIRAQQEKQRRREKAAIAIQTQARRNAARVRVERIRAEKEHQAAVQEALPHIVAFQTRFQERRNTRIAAEKEAARLQAIREKEEEDARLQKLADEKRKEKNRKKREAAKRKKARRRAENEYFAKALEEEEDRQSKEKDEVAAYFKDPKEMQYLTEQGREMFNLVEQQKRDRHKALLKHVRDKQQGKASSFDVKKTQRQQREELIKLARSSGIAERFDTGDISEINPSDIRTPKDLLDLIVLGSDALGIDFFALPIESMKASIDLNIQTMNTVDVYPHLNELLKIPGLNKILFSMAKTEKAERQHAKK